MTNWFKNNWPIFFLIIAGILGFYLLSLFGNAWNGADEIWWCGENPELCE